MKLFELWRRLPRGPKRQVGRWWYELLSSFDTGTGLLFMNHGYARAPDEGPLALQPEDEEHRFAIQLYHRVAGAIDWRGLDGLEVSCGRGGGANYVARTLAPRTLVGLDVTRSAIRFCERHYTCTGLSFRHGDAEHLPFPDGSFDVVLNVEASRSYPHPRLFFREVARVLRPGGHFLFADFRKQSKLAKLDDQLRSSGLEFVEREDISPRVAEALALDARRRAASIERLAPRGARSVFGRFAHVDDDERRRFESGEKVYLCCIAQKATGS